MPVQDARVPEVPVKGEARSGARRESQPVPRPAAVDAVRWAAALLTQLGLDPRAPNGQHKAA